MKKKSWFTAAEIKVMKFILALVILAFTSFCGYLMAKKYRQRKQFFDQLKEFNERFLSEVSYYRRPIFEFLSKYNYKGEFRYFLEDFADGIKGAEITFDEMVNSQEYAFLKKEDKAFLKDYFSMLGRSDSFSQKAYFSSANTSVEKLKMDAQVEMKKYGDLYLKLGFLCGLFIIIVII